MQKRHASENQRGVSLVEMVCALAVLTIIGGIIMSLLGGTLRAKSVIEPESRRTEQRSRIYSEIADAESGGARIWYVDAGATLALALTQASQSAAPHPPPAPPPTGGGGRTTTVSTGTYSTPIVQGFGEGVLLGNRLMLGPVAVIDAPMFDGQVGPLVATIRTRPIAPLKLARDWRTDSTTIEFVGSDEASRASIESLQSGDVLYLNGRDDGGAGVTLVVELRSFPEVVSNAAGYAVYSCAITPTDQPIQYGLSNTAQSLSAIAIRADATVAVLTRSEGVVCYATVRGGEQGGSKLMRIIGDPTQPVDSSSILDAAGPMVANLVGSGRDPGMLGPGLPTSGGTPTSLTLSIPLVEDRDGVDNTPVRVVCPLGPATRPDATDVRIVIVPSQGGGSR